MTNCSLVFGGSGFIGVHLIRALQQEGGKVISVDRRPPRERLENVTYLTSDVRDLRGFDPGKEIDAIYNLAAVHTTPGHLPYEYFETNVSGAVEITALASRLGVKEIVFTSSISVYGPGEDTKNEETAPRPESAYGRSKLLAERVHRRWLEQDSANRLIICRPAVVFGLGEGGNFTRMAKLLKRGFFVYPGRRDTVKACFYVGDLVSALLFAQSQPERYILFNGCYPNRYTLEQIVETLRSAYMPRARTFTIPQGIIVAAASVLQPFSRFGIGIHPDRVMKLVRSTDILPGWLESHGAAKSGRLGQALNRWNEESKGLFQ